MKIDISHVIVIAVIAVADVACLYFKLIPETAGVGVLTALVGFLVPTTYNSATNSATKDLPQ